MTPFEQRLSNLIEPSLEGMGYALVRVQMRGDIRKTLQIMAERHDRRTMTLNDCQAISETLSAVLDVHDPIKERYALEVSSPGIDRPLVKPADFQRYIGFEAKIDLSQLHEGRRTLRGIVKDADDTQVQIALENDVLFAAPLALIARAKLVLTDDLIEAHLAEQAKYDTMPISDEPIEIDSDLEETDLEEDQ